MKKVINRIPSFILYALPLIITFTIALLAFWPGIMTTDGMVQWNQIQTNTIDNWHPAYVTILMKLLTIICNNPTFIIFIQIIIISFIFSYLMTRLEKYYKVPKLYLLVASFIFAIIPLNYDFAICLVKDTIYSFLLLLVIGFTLDIINDKEWLRKWYNISLLIIVGLLVCLFRHNGIIVMAIYGLLLIIFNYKNKMIYPIVFLWIILYVSFTTIGFNLLNVKEANYANKYGPISHIYAQILNNDEIILSKKEVRELSNYADLDQLKNTYHPYNMDFSINSQKLDYIKDHGSDYIKFAIKTFKKYPFEVVKYYLKLDSYLYSPIPFPKSFVAGMYTESTLYIFEDVYPQYKDNSKAPLLKTILKGGMSLYQYKDISILTMRPALYNYVSVFMCIVLGLIYKNKKTWLISMVGILNSLSLAIAIPVASTRYVYISMISFYVIFTLFIYTIYNKRKNSI